jgi:hypothetical protein
MKQQELRPTRRRGEPLTIAVPSQEPSPEDKLRLEQAVLKIAQLIVRQIAREDFASQRNLPGQSRRRR